MSKHQSKITDAKVVGFTPDTKLPAIIEPIEVEQEDVLQFVCDHGNEALLDIQIQFINELFNLEIYDYIKAKT